MNGELSTLYVYPALARKKLKEAYNEGRNVYIYAMTGFGKTSLLQQFLKDKKVIWLDAAHSSLDAFDLEEYDSSRYAGKNHKQIVVVDNIQFTGMLQVRERILNMVHDPNLWVVLLSRSECPAWLSEVRWKEDIFDVIDEQDMQLSQKEIDQYLYLAGLDGLTEEAKEDIRKNVRGHGMALFLVVKNIRQESEHTGKLIWNEEIRTKTEEQISVYLNSHVFEQWDDQVVDAFMRLSVVDAFTVPLAKAIIGSPYVEQLLQDAMGMGNFLRKQGEVFFLEPVMRAAMRDRIATRYSERETSILYYNVGHYYRQQGEIKLALMMFEKGGYEQQVDEMLVEAAAFHPGAGYLYELRSYYLAMPKERIVRSVELMSAMSMLESIRLNPTESEAWYDLLKEKQKEYTGLEKKKAKSWLAYLDLALPHRGSDVILKQVGDIFTLIRNRQIVVPELSVTNNSPSLMDGGKDFCEWSKRDRELAATLGKTLQLVLGRYGNGLAELAVAESQLEKSGDDYEITRLIARGQMLAETGGKEEMCYVAVALMAKLHFKHGHIEDAEQLLHNYYDKVKAAGYTRMCTSIENELCRINLYKGDIEKVLEWMETAPDEHAEFCTLERERYLTKVCVYIMQEKWEHAALVLEKLMYYATLNHRTYLYMECEILSAMIQYRQNMDIWQETFMAVYQKAESYHFVRLLMRGGSTIQCMLEELPSGKRAQICQDRTFYDQVKNGLRIVSTFYPKYLLAENRPSLIRDHALDVLRLQAQGLSNKEIADALKISVNTVKYHACENYRKLNVKNKAEAVVAAKNQKII